jgi:hypothetical protein
MKVNFQTPDAIIAKYTLCYATGAAMAMDHFVS